MKTTIIDVPGIGPDSEKILIENGFKTLKGLAGTTVEKLTSVPGFGIARAGKVIKAANELLLSSVSSSARAVSPVASRKKQVQKKATQATPNKNTQEKLKKEKLKKKKLRKEKLKKEKLKKEKLKKEKLKKEKLKKKRKK